MEPRYRTILPIVGILFVIIVALIAFFIARRVRSTATQESPSPTASSASLILPSASPAASGQTNAPVQGRSSLVGPSGSTKPMSSIKAAPRTGPEDTSTFSVAFDDNGFRQQAVTVSSGTTIIWYNLGAKAQAIAIDGLSPQTVKQGTTLTYTFTNRSSATVSLSTDNQPTGSPQTITVK